MTHNQITQIRQLLKTFEWIRIDSRNCKTEYFCPACKKTKENGHDNNCAYKQALTLLPCPTCNGNRRIPNPTYGLLTKTKTDIIREIPCPDCQQHSS